MFFVFSFFLTDDKDKKKLRIKKNYAEKFCFSNYF